MAKRLGKFTKVWIEGYALTTLLTTAPVSNTYEEIEVGAFGQDKYYLAGRSDASLTVEGFFSDATGETHDALKSIASGSTTSIVTVAYGSNAVPTLGDPAACLSAQQLEYTSTPDLNGAIAINASFKPGRSQAVDFGKLLADETATANGNTSSIDDSSSSSAGAVGYFHIAALSAGDTITINIQDSTDDAAWADLVTCTLDGTAIDGERVAVAGNVDRYVRAEWVVTGAAISFPIAVSFVRL